jgi:hypothetical protein
MATDKSELRQLAPTHLLQALDAIAMARGMERHAYIEAVLTAEAKKVAHEAMVLSRCLQGNPLLSESTGVAQ